tara:strand:- start:433 stop:537 length:105 start_codon:yes stop_codon:yes gene_type:complete
MEDKPWWFFPGCGGCISYLFAGGFLTVLLLMIIF